MGAQLRLTLRQSPSFRREDFVVADSNRAAVEAVDAWPAWTGGTLALIGPEGSGKTHLGEVWAAKVGAERVVLSRFRTADVARLEGRPVYIDDGEGGGGEETLFHLINMAAQTSGSLLIGGRQPPSAWPVALPDLRSRLNALPTAILQPPGERVLRAVLIKLFRERNIRPTEDLLPYLLWRMERSVPQAQAIVDALDEAAAREGRSVSKALARRVLERSDALFED